MKKILILIAIAVTVFVSCKPKSTPVAPADEPVLIGIAWRADTTSEFYTNVVRALREAGAEPVLLPQMKMNGFDYDSITVAASLVDQNGVLLQQYADKVKQCVADKEYDTLSQQYSKLGAVVFTGGEDIAPTLLRQPQPWHGIEAEKDYNATRDISDYLTLAYCLDRDIPVLGMCRGMQMIVVFSGGAIIQDIPTYFAKQGKTYGFEHRNNVQPGQYRDYAPHLVTVLDTTSWLYKIAGKNTISGAPSWHHQAAGSVDGTQLRVIGTTNTNGIDIIEAVQRTDKAFVVGLQFHPEAAVVKCLDSADNAAQFMPYDEAVAYFKTLVEQARK